MFSFIINLFSKFVPNLKMKLELIQPLQHRLKSLELLNTTIQSIPSSIINLVKFSKLLKFQFLPNWLLIHGYRGLGRLALAAPWGAACCCWLSGDVTTPWCCWACCCCCGCMPGCDCCEAACDCCCCWYIMCCCCAWRCCCCACDWCWPCCGCMWGCCVCIWWCICDSTSGGLSGPSSTLPWWSTAAACSLQLAYTIGVDGCPLGVGVCPMWPMPGLGDADL